MLITAKSFNDAGFAGLDDLLMMERGVGIKTSI